MKVQPAPKPMSRHQRPVAPYMRQWKSQGGIYATFEDSRVERREYVNGAICNRVPRTQRRALRAMYRTCGYPGCDVSFDRCDIHHVIEWLRHGSTDLDNLLPLCSRHHHLVHEGHWRITLDTHRVLTVHRPDGTQHFHGTTTNRTRRDHRVADPARERATAHSTGPP